MRRFAEERPAKSFGQQAADQLPWFHIVVLLTQLSDTKEREWYAAKSIEYGWSRSILGAQIETNACKREGKAVTNFTSSLPAVHSDFAQQALKDPYLFDFLGLSLERIAYAPSVIDPVFLNTPQFVCEPLCAELGIKLTLKIETINPIRSFKGRGAELFMSVLCNKKPHSHVVCASAGNFGQAMAYSARKRKLKITVFAAEIANPLKIERMKSLGANVILHGKDFETAKLEAKRFAEEADATMVEDSKDVETAEGAGTIGLELLQLSEKLDVLLIPLGNGAMVNGIARIFKHHSPQTRIIAIQATGAPAMVESWLANKIIRYDKINTIADGIGVRIPIPEALEDMNSLIDDALLVSEEEIIHGMKLLHKHAGLVTEPSSAVGIAAIRQHSSKFDHNLHIGTIICGGNLTAEQMRTWLY